MPEPTDLVTVNFDGLVGPTHNFSGLAPGNLASTISEGDVSNPRAAALQGLQKMRAVRALGVPQAVLPPQMRPCFATLRQLGYRGSDEAILARVAEREPRLLRAVSSASSMWAANAATVSPACDAVDGRTHIVPANLRTLFHRSIEGEGTTRTLRAIFADRRRFVVHDPLPGGDHFADEGAANHTRLAAPGAAALHLFGWGRGAFVPAARAPARHPARQTREASAAAARLICLRDEDVLLAQQHPAGIDAGAFHTDVLAVGHGAFLMLHELAFDDEPALMAALRARFGDALTIARATDAELPVKEAVASYPFNSQIVSLPDGAMAIVAPVEARESAGSRAFLERVVAEDNPVTRILWLDVRESMKNGGGPACLRLRVPLARRDVEGLAARVLLDDALDASLVAWVERHYADRLAPRDLADPGRVRGHMTALDELTTLLGLGPIYDFQREPGAA